MNVNIKVVEVAFDVNIAKNGGGSYKGTRLTYRDEEGAIKDKNIHSNALKYNPKLKAQLSELKAGDDAVMSLEKEGEFWNIKEISKGSQAGSSESTNGNGSGSTGVAGSRSGNGSNPAPRSNYETPEERARRQVLIVRQSSVTSAIAYSATLKTPLPIADVLKAAEQIAAFVFESDFDDGSIEGLTNDIPL